MERRESGQWRTENAAAGGPDAASAGRVTPAGAPERRTGEEHAGGGEGAGGGGKNSRGEQRSREKGGSQWKGSLKEDGEEKEKKIRLNQFCDLDDRQMETCPLGV